MNKNHRSIIFGDDDHRSVAFNRAIKDAVECAECKKLHLVDADTFVTIHYNT